MDNDNFYKKLLNDSPMGYAYHKINCDEAGVPYDYEFLEVNDAFEKITGLDRKAILGKKITEAIPNIKEDAFNWIQFYGEIALGGEEQEFVQYSNTGNKWYKVKALSPEKFYFVTWFIDISEEKASIEELQKAKEDNLSIIEGANLGTFVWNVQTGEQIINDRWAEIIGYSIEELAPINIKTWENLCHPEDLKRLKAVMEKSFKGNEDRYEFEFRMKNKDGRWIWIHSHSKIISWTSEGNPLLVSGIHENITIGREMKMELEESEKRYRWIFEQAPVGIVNTSLDGRYLRVNQTFCEMIGYPVDELLTLDFLDITLPEDQSISSRVAAEMLDGKLSKINLEKRYQKKDGSIVWVDLSSTLMRNQDGQPLYFNIFIKDITEQIRAREILKKTMNEQKLLLDNLEAGVVIHAADTSIISWNPIAEKLWGLNLEKMKGKKATTSHWKFVDENGQLLAVDDYPVVRILKSKRKMETIILGNNVSKTSDRKWFLVNGYPLFDENKLVERVVINFIDITETRKAQEELNYLIYHNYLTGLYNRRFYEEELKRIDTKRNLPIALIMADINGLKLANDAFGHKTGDLLLIKAAEILKSECRADEIIARIGGDEFIILLPKTSKEEAIKLIERIKTSFEGKAIEGLPLSISLGYAVKKIKEENMNEIFKNAEDDMYRHKLSETSSMRSKTIKMIMNSLYEKNNREMLHSNRVGELCATIATHMYFSKDDVAQMRLVGQMHDIGKIGISEEILNKASKLDEEEWNEIKKHSEIGYRILNSSNEFSEIAVFVLEHQERWDGLGYPTGLKGAAISVEARIIAIADAYDAMTSDRTYRKGMDHKHAVEEITKCAGTQFDPEIVKIFLEKVLGEVSNK